MLGRSLCIGTDGNIWAGTYFNGQYYKLSAADGSVLAGPVAANMSPYGCLVDGGGTLWSASLGSFLGELNTNTNTNIAVHDHSAYGADYGIALGNGKVYQATYSGLTYIEHDPPTNAFSNPACTMGTCISALGIATDGSGDIFVGVYFGGGMYKFKPDGTLIWSSPSQTGGSEIRGVVVDSNGDVWAVHRPGNNISKFRGTDGAALGVFPVGLEPYTYSDATGLAALTVTTPTGFWTVVKDGGSAGTDWTSVSWTDSVPAGATLEVRVRAADNAGDLQFQTFQLVSNGGDPNLMGQYIEIQVKFVANSNGDSPILYDLTVTSADQIPPTPTPEPTATPVPATGRMTGGGSIGTSDVRHGFELHCNASTLPNRLEVNWGKGNKFHLETLYSAVCTDDPSIGPNPPAAGFDTYTGSGSGRYNGVSGATAQWTFTDAGEPGKNDYATITIMDANSNVVLTVSGNLKNGNHQAHK
jgi:hypothetical protein